MFLIRWALDFVLDFLLEAQRAPGIAASAALIAVTLAFFATAYSGLEPFIAGAVIAFVWAVDWLPFVNLAPFIDRGGESDLSFSLAGDGETNFLTAALLPIYAWLVLGLAAIRWLVSRNRREPERPRRFRRVLILVGVCGLVYLAAAAVRSDIRGLWLVMAAFMAVTLILGAWATFWEARADSLKRLILRAFGEDEA